jgi:hypothetical protein
LRYLRAGAASSTLTGKGGAEGSIGLLVDLTPDARVISVGPSDSGSCYDEKTGEGGSLGLPPTPVNCADSIDKRATSNEWIVRDYLPVGIYVLKPIIVRQAGQFEGEIVFDEVEITLAQAIAPFPDEAIYTANKDTFLKLDRAAGFWKAVRYNDIIAPEPDGLQATSSSDMSN